MALMTPPRTSSLLCDKSKLFRAKELQDYEGYFSLLILLKYYAADAAIRYALFETGQVSYFSQAAR